MLINPELKRNIWLDFSPHRVLLTATVVLLFIYVGYLPSSLSGAKTASYLLLLFFIFIWGVKNASEAVISEINNSTWDFQRQTAISPWSMTIGKLFGSTLFSWFGAGLALCVYTYAFIATRATNVFHEVMILILGGILAQGLALLLSLQKLNEMRLEKNNGTLKYLFCGAFVGYFFTTLATPDNILLMNTHWYNWAVNASSFWLISLSAFLFWTLLGLYRSFARELQYPQLPWAWLAFNIFALVYFSGFGVTQQFISQQIKFENQALLQDQIDQLPYLVAFIVAQTLTYIALFLDNLTIMRYRKLQIRFQQSTQEGLQQSPWWIISFGLAILVTLIFIVHQPDISAVVKDVSPAFLIFTSALFLMRDVALVHYFYFAKNPRRALYTSIIYLILLYMIVPAILSGLGMGSFVPLLLPSWQTSDIVAVISPLAQTAVLIVMMLRRWVAFEL